jgi:hypothetical protein
MFRVRNFSHTLNQFIQYPVPYTCVFSHICKYTPTCACRVQYPAENVYYLENNKNVSSHNKCKKTKPKRSYTPPYLDNDS